MTSVTDFAISEESLQDLSNENKYVNFYETNVFVDNMKRSRLVIKTLFHFSADSKWKKTYLCLTIFLSNHII